MGIVGICWDIVLSCNVGFNDQVVELDFFYTREGIQELLDKGYMITTIGVTLDQFSLMLRILSNWLDDETLKTIHTPKFPSFHVISSKLRRIHQQSLCSNLQNHRRTCMISQYFSCHHRRFSAFRSCHQQWKNPILISTLSKSTTELFFVSRWRKLSIRVNLSSQPTTIVLEWTHKSITITSV